MAGKTKEPLVHISRRDVLPWYKSMGIRAAAIVLSLLVCSLVMVLTTGENPLNVFAAIFEASFAASRTSSRPLGCIRGFGVQSPAHGHQSPV